MTVFKRKDRPNKPWVFEYKVEKDGKQLARKKSFATQKEAKLAEANFLVEHGGTVILDDDITFVDYFETWVETYKLPNISDNTLTKYATSRNTIEKYFKHTKVKDITRTTYQQFINWYIDDKKGHQHSKQSVEKLHSHASQCLESAVIDKLLTESPLVKVTLGGTEGKTEEEKFLETDEFEKLRDYCNQNANYNRLSLAMVQFAVYTGCRVSEIMAITWDDIDEKKNTVHINKSFNYHTWKPERDEENNIIWADKETVFLPTKNHEIRTLDVSPVLIASLHKLIQHQKINAINNPYHLVFCQPQDTVPTDNAVNGALKLAMKNTGIVRPGFTFHGLRHSHGSYLISKGIDMKYVSKRLGHKSLAITLKIYTHVLDSLKKQEAEKTVNVL